MLLRVKSSVFGIESIDLMRVKDSYTYTGHKNYIINEHENTFELASKFVSLDCFNEPNKFVKFLRKYRPRFDEKHERKIKQFLEGRTLLCQL